MNTNRTDIHEFFTTLVRLGIGTSEDAKIPNDVDWVEIKALANKQGLSAVVLDGIEVLRTNENHNLNLPDKALLTQWIGEVLQTYEFRYGQYKRAIGEMAGFYNAHGFKMMVLKGYACSLDWPKPNHRPCGDIDIWQFGQQKEADALLEKSNTNRTDSTNNFKIDKSHHHHTVFYWRNFMVENHYDFINVHHHKSNAELEKILKELGDDHHLNDNLNENSVGNRIQCVEVYGEKVYLPSPNLHALFLIKHMVSHFAAEHIMLRQILDWAFFVEKHHAEVDWEWLLPVIEVFHMKEFLNIVNAICVEDLGFDPGIFHQVQFNPYLKDRVLNDILSPEFGDELPKSFIPRLVFKYRRWKANEWKHRLCYKESMWSAFWSGVWNHLLKPASI